jgi:hypothetical protein
MPFQPGPYASVSEIINKHKSNGGHFFENGPGRGEHVRWGSKVVGGRYFVTSEKRRVLYEPDWPRRYTIRKASDEGDIYPVGDPGLFETSAQANVAIALFVKNLQAGMDEDDALAQSIAQLKKRSQIGEGDE